MWPLLVIKQIKHRINSIMKKLLNIVPLKVLSILKSVQKMEIISKLFLKIYHKNWLKYILKCKKNRLLKIKLWLKWCKKRTNLSWKVDLSKQSLKKRNAVDKNIYYHAFYYTLGCLYFKCRDRCYSVSYILPQF